MDINIYIIVSIFILISFPISHTKILTRKLDSLKNEISMRINGQNSLITFYNRAKNTPTELFIDGVPTSIEEKISYTTSQYYNIIMKWDHLLNDCSSMFENLTGIIEIKDKF